MNNTVQKADGTQREISWEELNQLKKDILWIFDENSGDFYPCVL